MDGEDEGEEEQEEADGEGKLEPEEPEWVLLTRKPFGAELRQREIKAMRAAAGTNDKDGTMALFVLTYSDIQ